MTDNEIIKVLECCTTNGASCKGCPAFVKVDRSNCKKYFRGALDLITRQKAENEALINGQETLQKHIAKKDNNSFSYNINAVSGTLRKSHPKSKFCVREVSDAKWVFDETKPRLTTNSPEIVLLQIMPTGESRALIEYVLKTDFEEMGDV